jgi:hypothetical protein
MDRERSRAANGQAQPRWNRGFLMSYRIQIRSNRAIPALRGGDIDRTTAAYLTLSRDFCVTMFAAIGAVRVPDIIATPCRRGAVAALAAA